MNHRVVYILRRKDQMVPLGTEKGFALPSILFIVLLLSVIIGSVLILQRFRRESVIREIQSVKALNAAENGINRFIAEFHNINDVELLAHQGSLSYEFEDNTAAKLTMMSWGMYLLVESVGKSGRVEMLRTALLACDLPAEFQKALYFANSSHQIIFTGSSRIEGDVLTGEAGVSVGSLRNYVTPVRIPIDGTVERVKQIPFPELHNRMFENELRVDRVLLENIQRSNIRAKEYSDRSTRVLSGSDIPDSVKLLSFPQKVTVKGAMERSSFHDSLTIVSANDIVVPEGAAVSGFVKLISGGLINIRRGASIEGAVLLARDSIVIDEGTSLSSLQAIAPVIRVQEKAHLLYPTILYSTKFAPTDSVEQIISLAGGSEVEGFVGLTYQGVQTQINSTDGLIALDTGAKVTGAVYSSHTLTLDGMVDGCVVTRDFYFYESPTTYLGWMRSGAINKKKLPEGFYTPLTLGEGTVNFSVLDWL